MADPLKRIRKFTLPVKPDGEGAALGAANQQRQLVELESNVSDMGTAIALAAMPRMARAADSTVKSGATVAPGQFLVLDSRVANLVFILSKPSPSDAGLFTALVDLGAGTGTIKAEAAQGCRVNGAASTSINTTMFGALFYCDGQNYWRFF